MFDFNVKFPQGWASKIRIQDAFYRGARRGMEQFVGHIARSQLSKHTDTSLGVQTNALRRSGRSYVAGQGRVKATWGAPNAFYGKLHQDGGEFTSKKKMFAIPLTDEAKKAGRPSNYKDQKLFPIKGKGGSIILARRQMRRGKNTGIIAMWVLKRTIRLPKRLHIPEEYKTTGKKYIDREIAKELVTQIRKM